MSQTIPNEEKPFFFLPLVSEIDKIKTAYRKLLTEYAKNRIEGHKAQQTYIKEEFENGVEQQIKEAIKGVCTSFKKDSAKTNKMQMYQNGSQIEVDVTHLEKVRPSINNVLNTLCDHMDSITIDDYKKLRTLFNKVTIKNIALLEKIIIECIKLKATNPTEAINLLEQIAALEDVPYYPLTEQIDVEVKETTLTGVEITKTIKKNIPKEIDVFDIILLGFAIESYTNKMIRNNVISQVTPPKIAEEEQSKEQTPDLQTQIKEKFKSIIGIQPFDSYFKKMLKDPESETPPEKIPTESKSKLEQRTDSFRHFAEEKKGVDTAPSKEHNRYKNQNYAIRLAKTARYQLKKEKKL